MHIKISLFTIISAIAISCTQTPKVVNTNHFTIVNYNVENLFDTVDTPNKMDEEFTPESKKQWNTERYNTKLNHIAQVISSIHPEEFPEIVGLTEVENVDVLNDLVKTEGIKAANYQTILHDGPDFRGIDCALLYRPDVFKYISHKALEVTFPFDNNKRTRDILYVKGLVKKDTLHLFVNHWSSRRGGQEKSEPKRVQSALILKAAVDSILALNADNKIFIMGDFNDNPTNKSIYEVLDAKEVGKPATLSNLMYDLYAAGKGSYFYKKDFDMLDNLIVSKALKGQTGFRLQKSEGYVFTADFLIYTNKQGIDVPSRTYGGPNYYGGYSDHFPTYTFFFEE